MRWLLGMDEPWKGWSARCVGGVAVAASVALTTGLAAAVPIPASQPSGADLAETLAVERQRLIRGFDFNEEPLGNYESLPMRWERHRARGFPHYLKAGFDKRVGYPAAPSFRLDLSGGSVAYHFRTRSIEALPASDYAVFAFIRTEKLRRARAFLGAAVMNRAGEVIAGSEVYSRRVGGEPTQGQWERISIQMPGGIKDARFITLSVWLTQSSIAGAADPAAAEPSEEIEDIDGTAWFDDIRVYRLPRVRLETGCVGNVFADPTLPSLQALVTDPDGGGLTATLRVVGADDTLCLEKRLPVRPLQDARIEPIQLHDLDYGLYRAEVKVDSDTGTLATRTLDFARLAPRPSPSAPGWHTGRGFGVTLSEPADRLSAGPIRLLNELGVEWVKVPVWSLHTRRTTTAPSEKTSGDLLAELAAHRHEIVGWIAPEIVTASPDQPAPDTLLDFLSSDAARWRPGLAYPWALYAGLIHWWQLGNEKDDGLVWDERWAAVLPRVGAEMAGLIEHPQLVMPSNVLKAADAASLASTPLAATASYVPAAVPVASFDADWTKPVRPGTQSWLTIEPPPNGLYPRWARLADFAKRLVLARASGAAAVFLEQPWRPASSGEISPTEEYILFRTIADALGDTTGAGRLVLEGRAECQILDRHGRAVLAVWDDYAPPEGRDVWIVLDDGARQIDAWGHVRPLERRGDECRVRIGRMPSFVEPVPTWLARFRQSFVLNPPRMEADLKRHELRIRFANPFRQSLTGRLRLIVPSGWSADPASRVFVLNPGQVLEWPVSVSFPITETAGAKAVLADFDLEADRRYSLRIPAWFDLGLDGIEVDAFAHRVGEDVIVRQSVTNHTEQTVSFYGYLVASQRAEIQRLIANLKPGQTITKEYELRNASALAGRRMRLGLREVDGGRVWNRLMEIP